MTVIHNPVSGHANLRRMRRFRAAIEAAGVRIALRPTHARGDAGRLAAEVSTATAELLAVAGGDGTINEVINAVIDCPAEHCPPIAVLPLGTANVLAAELGLPAAAGAVAETIAAGATARVHLPSANGHRFAVMAGVGFDAHVVAGIGGAAKRLLGRGAYVLGALRTLLRFPFDGYEVAIDGVPYRAASVVIANAHFYGGRFTCAPDARIDEPDLHVCLFLRRGRWSALRYALALARGSLHRRADVRIVRGRHVVVTGRTGDPVQCDGDIVTSLPLTVAADGRTLPFIVTERWFRSPASSPATAPRPAQRPATVIPSILTVGESVP